MAEGREDQTPYSERLRPGAKRLKLYLGVEICVHIKQETCICSLFVRFIKPHIRLRPRFFLLHLNHPDTVRTCTSFLTMPTIHYKWLPTHPQSPGFKEKWRKYLRKAIEEEEARWVET